MSGPAVSLEVVSRLDDARDEWATLEEHTDNVFATWEWLSTWWRAFGRGRPLIVGIGDDTNSRPRVILPLYLAARRPVRVLRLLGHGVSDQLGPVCAVGDRALAATTLRALLDVAPSPWDLFIADELPADVDWADTLGGRTLARPASPVVDLCGSTWETWFARRSANLRATIRRATRSLEACGTVTHRTTSRAEDVDRDLERLFELHDARWRETKGGSRAFARRHDFHRDFARQAFARGWLRLHFLEVDGQPVAGHYNLRFGGSESFYQSGRDPSYGRYSVGLLLHVHAIRDAIADGCHEYRFLRGDESYKRRFADRDAALQSVAVARTGVGRATRGLVARLPRLPREAVRRVPAPFAWGTGGSPRWGHP
jgi:CelD/BcsL family acetyltransferase involved in cellulose biosynthesis